MVVLVERSLVLMLVVRLLVVRVRLKVVFWFRLCVVIVVWFWMFWLVVWLSVNWCLV